MFDPHSQSPEISKFINPDLAITLSPILRRANLVFDTLIFEPNKDPLAKFLDDSLKTAGIYTDELFKIVYGCFELNPDLKEPTQVIKFQISGNSNGAKLMRELFGSDVESYTGEKADLVDLLIHQAVFLTNKDSQKGTRLTLESAKAVLNKVAIFTETTPEDRFIGYQLTPVGKAIIDFATKKLNDGREEVSQALVTFAGKDSLLSKLNQHYDTKLVRRAVMATDASNSITHAGSKLLAYGTVSATSVSYDSTPYRIIGMTIYHAAPNRISEGQSFAHQIMSAACSDYCLTKLTAYRSPKKAVLVLNQLSEIGMVDALAHSLVLSNFGERLSPSERLETNHLLYRKFLEGAKDINKLGLYLNPKDPLFRELKGLVVTFTNCVANQLNDDVILGEAPIGDILRAGRRQQSIGDLLTYQNFLEQLWVSFKESLAVKVQSGEMPSGILSNQSEVFDSILKT